MPKTVIITDEDPDDLDLMKQALEGLDKSLLCISFLYAEEALRVLLSKELVVQPDFIFIDINMPGVTGDKMFKNVKRKCGIQRYP